MEIVELAADELYRIEPLWLALTEHHHEVTAHAWPPQPVEVRWPRRRAMYERWLAEEPAAWALGAVEDGRLVGYAFVVARTAMAATWDLGEELGELETLSVLPEARGRGVGAALIADRREGFGPFFEALLGDV